MAVIHQATLRPSKREVLGPWLARQPWGAELVGLAGAYRLDDPDGEVGIEVHLVRCTDGIVRQVPLTFRGAPFADADLVGTSEHSVLGTRWVYDGCTDAVAVRALTTVITTGGGEAEEWVEQESGPPVRRQPTAQVRGVPPATDGGALVVRRVLDPAAATGARGVLLGTWTG